MSYEGHDTILIEEDENVVRHLLKQVRHSGRYRKNKRYCRVGATLTPYINVDDGCWVDDFTLALYFLFSFLIILLWENEYWV